MSLPQSDIAFAHAVRYRFAMLRVWAKRTGRTDRHGRMAYKPEDVPPYIELPTNDDISRAEVIEFTHKPVKPGETYTAYLAEVDGHNVITTFTGDILATVLDINSYKCNVGYLTNVRGSFWARGIDQRIYYGRHNGAGMYCRMRLSKNQKDMRQ